MSEEDPGSVAERQGTVGLLGMYGSSNLGDTAIQAVVMSALRKRRPGVSFIGVCTDPEDAVRTHGISSLHVGGCGGLIEAPCGVPEALRRRIGPEVPESAGAWSSLNRIRRASSALDMLLISGGGQIDDQWGGAWHQPFRLLAWCSCSRAARIPITAFAIGVDNLHSRLSSVLAVQALRMATSISFRDEGSLRILRERGLRGNARVCPDPAFAFEVRSRGDVLSAASVGRFAVISPIGRLACPASTDAQYERYLSALVELGCSLSRQGIAVRFVCSQTRMDPAVAHLLAHRMAEAGASAEVVDVETVEGFLGAVSGAQVVVAARLHAVILTLVAGVPVVALAPVRKVRQQMIDVGLEEYGLDLNSITVPVLLSQVGRAIAARDALVPRIAATVGGFRVRLADEFDRLGEQLDAACAVGLSSPVGGMLKQPRDMAFNPEERRDAFRGSPAAPGHPVSRRGGGPDR